MSSKIARDIEEATVLNDVTTTETGQSSGYDIRNHTHLAAYVETANAGGTSPTLDIKVQTYIAGVWVDTGIAFTQITGNASEYISNFDGTNYYLIPMGKIIRFVWTITGTSPTFDITLGFNVKS